MCLKNFLEEGQKAGFLAGSTTKGEHVNSYSDIETILSY